MNKKEKIRTILLSLLLSLIITFSLLILSQCISVMIRYGFGFIVGTLLFLIPVSLLILDYYLKRKDQKTVSKFLSPLSFLLVIIGTAVFAVTFMYCFYLNLHASFLRISGNASTPGTAYDWYFVISNISCITTSAFCLITDFVIVVFDLCNNQ